MKPHADRHGDRVALPDARLKRLAARRGVCAWDWEDCVQEAWLALLLEHPDWTLDEPRSWAFLRCVAHNKAVDVRRGLDLER